ncbi:Transcriptional regulator, AraC family [Citrifermentans bremense]|uniref:Transcriptional regulator, AraC family n=1 Tax=Citrifermentans bremense TaxID=60035 RepID=A0A6S6M090_9BACT|nr:AraC family transcriptional regulator [Citrifermentans bremense]BCG47223.1 Transcriptional regulator, AraC family [Citrifermentans bremense]
MTKQKNLDADEVINWDVALKTLAKTIARWTTNREVLQTAIPGLTFFHHNHPTEPGIGVHEPSVCVVAQGAKKIHLEDETFIYDANNYLIASVHMPTIYQVISATPEEPYLGLLLKFDMRELSQLMIDSNLPSPRTKTIERAIATGEMTLPLLGAIQRLASLLDEPESIPILAPMLHREILFRLLNGEQGARLRKIASAGSSSHQVARAIDWLRVNFCEQLRVEDLAESANMSPSSFHSHFRSMTSLSPLQYQKHLRLQEARRIMLAENLDATSAAFRVGYESSSQFSREYSRLFGAPPLRDISQLRRGAAGITS